MFLINFILIILSSYNNNSDAVVVNPETYILHPRDRMQLVVSGAQGFIQDMVVNSDGTMIVSVGVQSPQISEPTTSNPGETTILTADYATGMPLGVVYADGKTLQQVENEVKAIVKKYFYNVSVNLVIVRPRHFVIKTLGEVYQTTPIEVTSFVRVSDIISRIRLSPKASLSRIQIIHPDSTIDTADMIMFINTGDPRYNPSFRGEGDVLFFPEIQNSVIIKGAILPYGSRISFESTDSSGVLLSTEAIYELLPNDNIEDIIKRSGGFLPWADKKNMILLREGLRYPIDGTNIKELNSFYLQNEDTIIIPEIRNNIIVTGAVNNPGEYGFVPLKTAFEYVNISGGVTDRGMIDKVEIYSSEGVLIGKGISAIVERGNIIKVPEVTLKFWSDYTIIGGFLISTASLIIALTR